MKKDKGFTLIELLVVVSMIIIVLTAALLNSTGLGNRARVEAAANEVFNLLKEARYNSVSVREFKNNLFPSYGVYFDINFPSRIIIYADCLIDDVADDYIDDKDNFTYDPLSQNCNGGNGLVKEITLNSRVLIKEIRSAPSVGGGAGSIKIESKVYLEYVRPEPTVWITLSNASLLEAGKIEIDLADLNGQFKKTIILWSTGQFAINL